MKIKTDFIKEDDGHFTVVLYAGKTEIGLMQTDTKTSVEVKSLGYNEAWQIEHFHVDKEFRGKGYSKLMLETLCNGIKQEKGEDSQIVIAYPAGHTPLPELYHIYKHLGFSFLGRDDIPNEYNVFMYKII